MSGGELILTIKSLKEKYESEWKSIEDDFMATIEEIRKFVTEKTKKGETFTKEDAETILNLVKNAPQASRFLLRYIGSVGSDKKHVITNLLSNENFSKLLDALESEKFDEIKLLAERLVQTVYNVGYSTLTTWLAILRPDLFIPLWGFEKENGTIPQSFLRKFYEIKKFTKWWYLEIDELFEFLGILKKIANSVRIDNLFELAFYLNKYQERRDIATRRFWLIAPGKGAEYWNTCVKREIICVGWRNAIEKYGKRIFELDYDKFKNLMKNEFGYGDFHELWKFLREVSIGDIVFAKKGMKEIIGIGIVESGPEIDLELGDYPIYRKVKWINKNLRLESPKQFRGTVAELTYEEIERSIELRNLVDSIIQNIPSSKDSKDELDEETKSKIESLLNYKKQIILYGPPGTGKTWTAQNYVMSETNNKKFYEFVTFHPSYSYEEFVEGLKPIPAETTTSGLKFIVEDGIFKRIAIKAICEALKLAENLKNMAEELLNSLKEIENGNLNEYDRYLKKKRDYGIVLKN